MLECIYIFAWIICIASKICLSSKREKGLWTQLVRILLQFQLRDILELAFVEGVLPDMGACFDTKKEHQATRELWKLNLHSGVPSLGCLCLTLCA